MSCNTHVPIFVAHAAVTGERPFTIGLDSDLGNVPQLISMNLRNSVKHLGGTVSPSRAGGGLDIIRDSMKRNLEDKVSINLVDGRI